MIKINVGVFGVDGKMGKAVMDVFFDLNKKNKLHPFLCVSKKTSKLFSTCVTDIKKAEAATLRRIDVWVDFSSAKGLRELLAYTDKFKTPVVSGSTGLTDKDFAYLKKSSKKRSLFWSSNMSPGLWAFRQALKGLETVSNFDFAIEEIHHVQKKDNPSGTAKTLQADLEKIINKKIKTPTGFRLGGVFGVHKVFAASSNEVISLQHEALDRKVFAEGAKSASLWILRKPPGLYSMDDLFKK